MNNMTLEQLNKTSEKLGISLYEVIRSFDITDYSKFIKTLYQDFELAIKNLENNKKFHFDKNEDEITHNILTFLAGRGFSATHDTFSGGGHCDLVVTFKSYKWLGEAKIYDSPSNLSNGYKQLFTRYSTGTQEGNCGGIIVYCKKKDALTYCQSWKNYVNTTLDEGSVTGEVCALRSELSFYSKHKHQSSGLDYHIKHIFTVLHYDPKK